MCIVVYIASRLPLPEIPWRNDAPAFNVSYVREHHVEQIYSCWSGDEGEPQVFVRSITPEALVAEDFFLRERELLTIVNGTS